jgi:hypothetical protein
MRIILVLTALVLGATAGSVVAQPDRPRYDDPRHDRFGRQRWVTLTTRLANYRGREIIPIGRQAGPFERLRLDVEDGRVFVRQVRIDFADGTSQRLVLGRFVNAGQHVAIDVPGRARYITRVVVFTDPARGWRGRGEYRISGARARRQYGYDPYHDDRYRRRDTDRY